MVTQTNQLKLVVLKRSCRPSISGFVVNMSENSIGIKHVDSGRVHHYDISNNFEPDDGDVIGIEFITDEDKYHEYQQNMIMNKHEAQNEQMLHNLKSMFDEQIDEFPYDGFDFLMKTLVKSFETKYRNLY